jgi:DNA-binding NarL/FixJ family response regulator
VTVPARPRVLLADDYPAMVKAIGRLLARDCDVVGSVVDGSLLMAAVESLHPDVVVLDLSLPNTDGLDACRQLTHAYPTIKVIVFTARLDPTLKNRSVAAGASAFVSKMSRVDDLLSTITRLCADAPSGAPASEESRRDHS